MSATPLPQRITSNNAMATRGKDVLEQRAYYRGEQAINRTGVRRRHRAARNMTRLMVDTVASYVGRATISWGDDDVATELEARLAAVESAERLEQKDAETETACAVDGDSVWKVTFDDREKRVRVAQVDPRGVYVECRRDDPTEVELVAQQYTIGAADYPALFGSALVPAGGERSRITEAWTAESWQVWENNILRLDEPNPYGLLPYVVSPNVRAPFEFWGTSDVRQLMALQDELNEAETDTDGIMALAGNIVVITGADSSEGLAVAPGQVWELPPDSKAEVLELLAGNHIGQRKIHLDHLRDTIYALAQVPGIAALGGDLKTGVSGLALQIQLGPVLRLVARKRLTRGTAYAQRARLIAVLDERFGGGPAVLGHEPSVLWQEPVPGDRAEQLTAAETELRLGRDREAVLRSIGVEDPGAELAARKRQDAALGVTLTGEPSNGRGTDPQPAV